MDAALVTNLHLLGLPPARGVTPLHAGLFRQTNAAALEHALHFLLSKIDPRRARADFADCWPIRDRQQAREFRKIALVALQDLDRSGVLPHPPRLSLLQQASGERLYELLYHLSCHALQTVLERDLRAEAPQRPAFDPARLRSDAFFDAVLRSQRLQAVMLSRRFVTRAKDLELSQTLWTNAAGDLVARYHTVLQQLSAQRQEQREFDASVDRDALFDASAGVRRHAQVETMRVAGKAITAHQVQSKQMWELLDSVGRDRSALVEVSGTRLAETLERGSQAATQDLWAQYGCRMDPAYADQGADDDGDDVALNINTLVGQWNACLETLYKAIAEMGTVVDSERLEPAVQSVQGLVDVHKQYLANVTALNTELRRLAPAVADSVSRLRDECWGRQPVAPLGSSQPRPSPVSGKPPLALVPPTPAGARKLTIESPTGSASHPESPMTAFDPLSPTAVAHLAQSVRRAAARGRPAWSAPGSP